MLYIVCLGKDYMYLTTNPDSVAGYGNSTDKPSGLVNSLGLKDLEIYIASSVILCFATYWGIGIALDLYFYKNRKHKVRLHFMRSFSRPQSLKLVYELNCPLNF